jgi:superfamily II DNA or RNA helicase
MLREIQSFKKRRIGQRRSALEEHTSGSTAALRAPAVVTQRRVVNVGGRDAQTVACTEAGAGGAAANLRGSSGVLGKLGSPSTLSNGLVILLRDLKASELAFLERSLTFYPHNAFDKHAPVEPLLAYRIDASSITVPRMFGAKMVAPPPQDLLSSGLPLPDEVVFVGELKPIQADVVDATCAKLAAPPFGGLVSMPCGFGKTVVGLAVAARLGRKTLVVVHKEFLLEQWRERVKFFLPSATVGTLQGKTENISCDVVIGMIQTIAARQYDVSFFDGFGTIVLDEVHHFASRFFSLVFFHNRIRHVLGLSATPKRKDGLTALLHHYVGDFAALVEESSQDGRSCRVLRVHCRSPNKRTDELNPAAVQRIKGKLVQDASRNSLIIELVAAIARSGRKQIVLSERVSHLEGLAESFALQFPAFSCSLYIGSTKRKDRPAAVLASAIFATFAMAAEGLDVAALDTLVLASPYSDVTQPVGRILRQCAAKKPPLVIDVADDYCQPFERASAARASTYRRCGYEMREAEPSGAMQALREISGDDPSNAGEI